MKFKQQNIIFYKVFSRMSLFLDTDFGRMGPIFKCTVYFFSSRWYIVLHHENHDKLHNFVIK